MSKRGNLNPTEDNVLRLIGHGLSTKQIAARLGLKSSTIDMAARSLNKKLGTTSRTQVALYAVRSGAVNLDEVTL